MKLRLFESKFRRNFDYIFFFNWFGVVFFEKNFLISFPHAQKNPIFPGGPEPWVHVLALRSMQDRIFGHEIYKGKLALDQLWMDQLWIVILESLAYAPKKLLLLSKLRIQAGTIYRHGGGIFVSWNCLQIKWNKLIQKLVWCPSETLTVKKKTNILHRIFLMTFSVHDFQRWECWFW